MFNSSQFLAAVVTLLFVFSLPLENYNEPLESHDIETTIVFDGWTEGLQEGSILSDTSIAIGGATDASGTNKEFVCIVHDVTLEIYCWGSNDEGQLGQGWIGGYSATPSVSPFLPTATSISAGSKHACGIKSGASIDGNADIFCWGDNKFGQFGKLDITTNWAWLQDGIDWNQYTAQAISSGGHSSCAILVNTVQEKSLWCWGELAWQNSNLLTPPDYQRSCSLGQIWMLDVTSGPGYCINLPLGASVDLDGDGWMVHQPTGNFGYTISAFGPGDCDDTLADVYPGADEIPNNNRDDNCNGLVDNGNNHPIQVQLPGIEQPMQVSLGLNHGCVASHYQSLYCWGSNDLNQLTGQSTGIVPVENFINVDFSHLATGGVIPKATLVAAGSNHTCAIMSDHSVSCWGFWTGGGSNSAIPPHLPTRVSTTDSAWNPTGDWDDVYSQTHDLVPISITAGEAHTCINAHNTLLMNYMNSAGYQLSSIRPVAMCWGSGGKGQLGQGQDFNNYHEYKPIYPNHRLSYYDYVGNSVTIIAGGDTTCSVTSVSEKAIRCFGSNDAGTYGHDRTWPDSYYSTNNPTADSRPARSQGGTNQGVSIKNYDDIIDFDTVGDTGCFITRDDSTTQAPNSMYCWGILIHAPYSSLTNPVLFSNQYTSQSAPQDRLPKEIMMPPGLSPQSVKVSENWACAIMDDQTVWCWGEELIITQLSQDQTSREECSFHSLSEYPVGISPNYYCQGTFKSGDGTSPADLHQIPLSEGATSLRLGVTSGCASTTTGKVLCWGTNYDWGTKQSSWQSFARWMGGYPSSAPTNGLNGNSNFATQTWTLLDGSSPSTTVPFTQGSDFDKIFSGGGGGTWIDLIGKNMCIQTITSQHVCYGSQVSVLNIAYDENRVNTWLDTDDPAYLDGQTLFGAQITSAAKNVNSVCVTAGGDIHCAGKNNFGQLGNGLVASDSLGHDWTMVSVPSTKTFDTVVTNNAYSMCAWSSLNPQPENVFCWGSNFAELPVGQGCLHASSTTTPWVNCYSGNKDVVNIPTQAFLLHGVGSISKLQLHEYGGCVLADGNLGCWGHKSYGNNGCQMSDDMMRGIEFVIPGCTIELKVHLSGVTNSLPSISSISLTSNETPNTLVVPSSSLICELSGVMDPDAHTVEYEFEYIVTTNSGQSYTHHHPSLSPISVIDIGTVYLNQFGYSLAAGDEIQCIGTVTDSLSGSTASISSTLIVSGQLYPDLDGDGFGDSASPPIIVQPCTTDSDCPPGGTPIAPGTSSQGTCVNGLCSIGPGYSENNLDCDDSNPVVNPGAIEDPYNGIDDDCDGVEPTLYLDWDNDGFGDPNYPLVTTCSANADCSGNDVCHTMLGHSTCIDTSHPIFTETCTDSHDCDVKYLKVASGNLYSCALTTTHYVVCWGAYTTDPNPHPGVTFADIEAGAYGMCGITQATNSVLCWNLYGDYFSPSNQYERLQVPNVQFQSIKLDLREVCGLTTSGELYCESLAVPGSPNLETQSSVVAFDMANSLYDLGHRCHIYDNVGASNIDNIDCIIGENSGHTAAITPPSGLQFGSIATGYGWSCGLVVGGTAECWGNSNIANHYILQNIPGDQFQSISAGMNTICGINDNFEVKCWGKSFEETAWMTPPPGTTAKSVSVGRLHVCSITLDDDLYCWGNDGYSGTSLNFNGLLSIPTNPMTSCINGVCSIPNYVLINTPDEADCNDQDDTVYPTNTEVAGNAIDDNCNGQIDELGQSNSMLMDNMLVLIGIVLLAVIGMLAVRWRSRT